MSSTNKISVIIPVYNAEQYIKQCIKNINLQSYKNLEIIIVDDGSTDNTAKIAKQYNVKYLYQNNSGVYSARNLGLKNATGDYIHFMDVDDIINIDFYESVINNISNTQAEIACCSFIFERYKCQSKVFNTTYIASEINDKISLTDVNIYGACWRFVFNRNFIENNNLSFENGRAAFDRVFTLKAVFLANLIVSVPNAIYIYKNRGSSITTDRKIEAIRKRHADRKSSNALIKEFAEKHQLSIINQIQQLWQYKILGIPVVSKKIIHNGNIKWYFCGINIFQKKEI